MTKKDEETIPISKYSKKLIDYFDENKEDIFFKKRYEDLMREYKRIHASSVPFRDERLALLEEDLELVKNKDKKAMSQAQSVAGSHIYLSPNEVNVEDKEDAYDITIEPKSDFLAEVAKASDVKVNSIQNIILLLHQTLTDEEIIKSGVYVDTDSRRRTLRLKKDKLEEILGE